MKIDEILKNRRHGISFEFFPPRSSDANQGFIKVVNTLRQYNPIYVSVTYRGGESTKDRTRNTLMLIKKEIDLTVMSHLTCIGVSTKDMDSLLKDYMANGIDNILALRGDPLKGAKDIDPIKGECTYAKDIVKFIKKYNYFAIAVGVYPEGHPESPSIEKDMEYTKDKIDAGADFAITQMFFDNRYYYDFIERANKAGIKIPILPGIMPITDYRKIKEFADFCKATIPKAIREKMESVIGRPDEMMRLGIEYAIEQCRDLLKNGVRFLHFYTLNKSEAVSKILDAIKTYLH